MAGTRSEGASGEAAVRTSLPGRRTFTSGSTFQLPLEDGVLVPAEGTGSPGDLLPGVLVEFLEGDDPAAVAVGVILARTPRL